MTEQEIERCLERFTIGKATDVMNFDYAGTFAYIQRLKAKNAELCHRAEVVERAFDNTTKVFHEMLSAIFPSIKIDLDEWKKDNLAIAEKELAEGKKE